MTDTQFDMVSADMRLADKVDWYYLAQEFAAAYRHGSSGGSNAIRSHMRQVRARLSKCLKDNPVLRPCQPTDLPVTRHLPRAIDNGERAVTEGFVRAVAKVSDQLSWQYGYEKVPKSLEKRYGYAEIMGPNGPIFTPDIILGLVLFAPGCTYPAHRHDGIQESYICLSGTFSENDAGVFPPGSTIFNRDGFDHTITSAHHEPVLLAYAWIGDPERLAEPGMAFNKPARRATGASMT